MTAPLILECFRVGAVEMPLVSASPSRKWMDDFPDRHAYRCLPLTIANVHGWDILSPFDIHIEWNGGAKIEDIVISTPNEAAKPLLHHVAKSNFSRGIVTLHTGFLFRTSPGWNLLATGTWNKPKKHIYPLTGVVETHWLPYPFTMNWQLMVPGIHRFQKDEPICTIIPIPHAYLENVTPRIYDLKDDPVLSYEQDAFRQERDRFMEKFRAGDQATIKQAWQKHYFVGRMPDSQGERIEGHINKMRLADPEDRRGQKAELALNEPRVKQRGDDAE